MKESALYLHIPFCDHKCIYCDFYSIITSDNIGAFFRTIRREIDFYSELYSGDNLFTSVFFGGGTPSLMSPDDLAGLIGHLKDRLCVAPDTEITMETNPGTVTEEKLRHFLEAGINRISIGIQSFDNDELRFLTRIHDSRTAAETVAKASKCGFNNISIDLIFNLPGQTKEKWTSSLQQAASLPINHISAYSLILERGTILNKLVLDGIVTMQDDDYDADLYAVTIDYLNSAGFNQYEVSNFARPGYECRHNKAYWEHRNYLGLGPSAHSFMDGRRWWNYSSLKRYISEIEIKGTAVAGSESPSREQLIEESVMLGLRSGGLDLDVLEDSYGAGWYQANSAFLGRIISEGFAVKSGNRITLTPAGYALCDEIIAKLK